MPAQPERAPAAGPQTMLDKIWARRALTPESPDHPAVLYIDLHLVHEVTSPQAFAMLAERGLSVRRPDRTFATIDHSTPTLPPAPDGRRPYATPAAEAQVEALRRHCAQYGIRLADWASTERGIVHVTAPELGLTLPGTTVVCGDSHTATHGAFGALAFGIGTTEVGHVLATQCLLQRKPRSLLVRIEGGLGAGVSAKDLTLAVIARLGFAGGSGTVIEYAGAAVRALDMEARMTLCNMSIEAGARAGMIAPDDVTIDYLRGRAYAPRGVDFEAKAADWRRLASDEGAVFDREIVIDAGTIAPMATYAATPDSGLPIGAPIPLPAAEAERAGLAYMGFAPGERVGEHKIQVVFIGSCTNGRLSDLRAAAEILRGRRIAPGVRMLVAPGSEAVRRAAEAEGLDAVFRAAGAEWRLPGCSMCIAMNGDQVGPGELAVSTTNRNFEGRQGKGARTILASPATAAASALCGALADPRLFTGDALNA